MKCNEAAVIFAYHGLMMDDEEDLYYYTRVSDLLLHFGSSELPTGIFEEHLLLREAAKHVYRGKRLTCKEAGERLLSLNKTEDADCLIKFGEIDLPDMFYFLYPDLEG